MGFFPRYIKYACTNKAGRRGARFVYRNIVQVIYVCLCVLTVVYTCVLTVYYMPYNIAWSIAIDQRSAGPKAQKNLPKYIYLNFFN